MSGLFYVSQRHIPITLVAVKPICMTAIAGTPARRPCTYQHALLTRKKTKPQPLHG